MCNILRPRNQSIEKTRWFTDLAVRTARAGVLLLPSLSIIVLRRNVCLSRQLHIPPTDAFVVAFVAKLTVQNLVPKVSRVREMEQNQKSTKKIFRNYGRSFVSYLFFPVRNVSSRDKRWLIGFSRLLVWMCVRLPIGGWVVLWPSSLRICLSSGCNCKSNLFLFGLKPMVLW